MFFVIEGHINPDPASLAPVDACCVMQDHTKQALECLLRFHVHCVMLEVTQQGLV